MRTRVRDQQRRPTATHREQCSLAREAAQLGGDAEEELRGDEALDGGRQDRASPPVVAPLGERSLLSPPGGFQHQA